MLNFVSDLAQVEEYITSWNILAANNNPLKRLLFYHRNNQFRVYVRLKGPMLPRFKFNTDNLFNEHFPWLIFFKSSFSRKHWPGCSELSLKNGIIDGYAY